MKQLIKLTVTTFFLTVAFAAHAHEIKFDAAISDGFVHGQFTCTEINEYGSMNYACGGNNGDGVIRSLPAQTVVNLPSNFLEPYHSKLKIIAVFITSFTGEIQQYGEKMVSCLFSPGQLTATARQCIILTDDGNCRVSDVCQSG